MELTRFPHNIYVDPLTEYRDVIGLNISEQTDETSLKI